MMSDAEIMQRVTLSLEGVAYINGQVACALIEMEGMKAANQERQNRGEALAYPEASFSVLIEKYTISHNAVRRQLDSVHY